MKIKIFIDGKEVDLFKDESIQVTSKLGDIEKLSSVFTDFSNSFTIPATPNNNIIFKHYYDVDIDNTFNANIRVDSMLEIDTYPFKYGQIQLEGIKLKNKRPDSYKITFYGGLKQLNDIFGEDTLSQLDFTDLNYIYDETNFLKSVKGATLANQDIITPLISIGPNTGNARDWNYNEGSTSLDITKSAGAILDSELRPAIRVIKIIESIENKYGITFSRDFFGTSEFQNLFFWGNNSTGDSFYVTDYGAETPLNIVTDIDTSTGLPFSDAGLNINVADKTINKISGFGDNVFAQLTIVPAVGFTTVPYGITIYLDGIALPVFETSGTQSIEVGYENVTKITVKAKSSFTYTALLTAESWEGPFYPGTTIAYRQMAIGSTSTSPKILNFSQFIPGLKVTDFIQGIMKMFKMIIRPISSTDFYMDTLNSYYSKGNIIDITNDVNIDQMDIDRPMIYKNIIMKYQKTSNVLGKKYRNTVSDPENDEIGYGDIKATLNNIQSKDELKVELPFENMYFERLGATGDAPVVIGQSLSLNSDGSTLSKNKSKPILFYNNGIISTSANPIYFKWSVNTAVSVNTIYLIGSSNNELLSQVTASVNFNAEVDPWHKTVINNSLYKNYWENWINTIYDLKQRKISVDSVLPNSIIQELTLNDRLIIGDQRYKINDYTINLMDGTCKMNIFKDIYDFSVYNYGRSPFSGLAFLSLPLNFIDYSPTNVYGSHYILGDFSSYGGITSTRLLKIKENGSIDTTFNAGTSISSSPSTGDSIVKTSNDGLFISGSFTTYKGVSANRIVKVHPTGDIDTTFSYGTGFNAKTNNILLDSSDRLLVTGQFTSYNGTSINRIALLNGSGTLNGSFSVGTGFNGNTFSCIEDSNEDFYVSGEFTSYNGTSRSYIAKITDTGTLDTTFNPGTSFNTNTSLGLVKTLDSKPLAYGAFTSYNGATAGRIVKLNSDGSIDTTFGHGIGFNNTVSKVKVLDNNNIFVTGSFTSYEGISISNPVILSQLGNLLVSFTTSSWTNFHTDGIDVYAIDTGGILRNLTREPVFDILNNEIIYFNAGQTYNDINYISYYPVEISILDQGFGTSWANYEEVKDGKISVGVNYNSSTTTDRYCLLKLTWSNDPTFGLQIHKYVTIYQKHL